MATSNENQSDRFEIERSADAAFFEKIGELAASGTGTSLKAYNFTDHHTLSSSNYYRLKMIDADGKFKYSHIVAFAGSNAPTMIAGNASPNPFTEVVNVNLTLAESAPVTLTIMDLAGRVLQVKTVEGSAGQNALQMGGLNQLAAGMYNLRITSAGKILQQKIIKVKR